MISMEVNQNFTQVALLLAEDRNQAITKIFQSIELPFFDGKTVLIKPNLNSADPFPGSTHMDTLRTLITEIKQRGAKQIIVGDRSGMGDTREVMKKLGVFDLRDEFEFDVMVFDELPKEDWNIIQYPDSHWKNGFAVPKIVSEVDLIIQTCCLKTHRYGGHFTMSLKNSVGLVAKKVPGDRHDYMRELHISRSQRKMIAEINTTYKPDLVLLDGIQAFTKGGPAKGTLVSPNVLLVGKDRVAIDAIGVAILRKYGTTKAVSKDAIFDHPQIARAAELGVGIQSPEQVKMITHDERSTKLAEEIQPLLLD